MKYEIVELEEKIVEGIAIKTSNQDAKSIQDIGETWQKLFVNGIYEKIQNKVLTKQKRRGKMSKLRVKCNTSEP